ncbi:Hypothetical predicted protein [Pelobates cultripes]|uniref:Uncharacterized protein n=1 Tax=Pelobates cultripes TaxID=61616 RepID=A0AAD1WE61_PELCU|nr:Hypothetical predicted protein [Pelobates cultripes]
MEEKGEGNSLCLNGLQKVAASSSLTPTQSPDILAWIRKEVAQGISEAMEGRKRSEKRPRQRQVSSESSASECQDPSEEFQVIDQVGSNESKEEILLESLDAKTVDKLILMARKTLEIPEELPKSDSSDRHFADLRKQKLYFTLHRAICLPQNGKK